MRRIWRETNSDYNLKRMYGIDKQEYNRLLKAQGGVCAICQKPPAKRKLAVDHSHSTSEVRGLLCHICNTALEQVIAVGADKFVSYLAN